MTGGSVIGPDVDRSYPLILGTDVVFALLCLEVLSNRRETLFKERGLGHRPVDGRPSVPCPEQST